MSDTHKDVDAYWKWFEDHRADFDAMADAREPFWDVALEQLKRLDSRLWFELSKPDGNDRELVITAQGDKEAFPLVETIVARAPRIPGWQVIGLKPAMGFDFVTTYEGIRFDPRAMWFLPLESASRPLDLGLRVGVPNFSSDIARQARSAVAVILDTALGERAATLEIQHLDVGQLPPEPEVEGYIELYELPKFIEWRKRKN